MNPYPFVELTISPFSRLFLFLFFFPLSSTTPNRNLYLSHFLLVLYHSGFSIVSMGGVMYNADRDGNKVTTVVATPGAGPDRPQEISYTDTKVIGNGSFGVVYLAKLCDTEELVAIKKVLQDKRFKVRGTWIFLTFKIYRLNPLPLWDRHISESSCAIWII